MTLSSIAARLVIVTPRAYSVSEAAKLLSVDRATAYRLIHDGTLRFCTIRSKLLVPEDAITEYLQRGVDLSSGRGSRGKRI